MKDERGVAFIALILGSLAVIALLIVVVVLVSTIANTEEIQPNTEVKQVVQYTPEEDDGTTLEGTYKSENGIEYTFLKDGSVTRKTEDVVYYGEYEIDDERVMIMLNMKTSNAPENEEFDREPVSELVDGRIMLERNSIEINERFDKERVRFEIKK